ncbi:MAG: hypothetical protein ABIX10_02495, partial [Acidimicrobiales bacterium]
MELVVPELGDGLGERGDQEASGARGGPPPPLHQLAERPLGLEAGDLLAEDSRDQGLEHPPGARQAQALGSAVQVEHEGMLRLEPGPVIEDAEPTRRRLQGPRRPLPPCLELEVSAGVV